MGAASLATSLVASAASVYVESSGSCGGNTPCYSTIQAAIDAASSGNAIKIAEGSYDEALSLSSSKDLTLQGGWDSAFTSQSSNTTVNSLTISNGSIEVDKLISHIPERFLRKPHFWRVSVNFDKCVVAEQKRLEK